MALEKRGVFALEPIELAADLLKAPARDVVGAIENQRSVGREARMGGLGEPLDEVGGHPFARALVGRGGVAEAVTHDGSAAFERRADHAIDMIGARGEDEQGLEQRAHGLGKDRLAQAFREIGPSGLARDDDVLGAAGTHGIGDELDMGRLSRAVHTFKSDELAARAQRPPR